MVSFVSSLCVVYLHKVAVNAVLFTYEVLVTNVPSFTISCCFDLVLAVTKHLVTHVSAKKLRT